MLNEMPPEVGHAAPGLLGALVSMLFMRDVSWKRRIGLVFAGSVCSWYATASLVEWTHLNAGFAGFLTGLFGMGIVATVFDAWLAFDASSTLSELVRALLRLPPKGDK